MIWRPPTSTLFPYTTLFRSARTAHRTRPDCRFGTLPSVSRHSSRPSHVPFDRLLRRPCASVTTEGTRCLLLVLDRKSTRLNSSHLGISYAVFCLKKKKDRRTSPANPVCTWSRHQGATRYSHCSLPPQARG